MKLLRKSSQCSLQATSAVAVLSLRDRGLYIAAMFRSPREDIAQGTRTHLPGNYQCFMMAIYTLSTLLPFGILFAIHIVAIEIPANKFADAAVVRCQDIASFDDRDGPDPTCWNTLNMTEQMKNWSVSGPGCEWDEGWADCYYRLGLNATIPLNCTERVPVQSCPLPLVDTRAEIAYGGYSIIGTFFAVNINAAKKF